MRKPLVPLLLGIAWLIPGLASAQSLAELLPEKTLLYAEVQQPGELAKEIQALLRGTYLENVPESIAPLLKKSKGRLDPEAMLPGLMLAPEVLREVGRIKGAAVAVTGIDKGMRGMPTYVVLVQPGESNVPAFVMRLGMSMGYGSHSSDGKRRVHMRGGFERVDEVAGVGVYRMMRRTTTEEGGKTSVKEEAEMYSPSLAQTADLLLLGSHDEVKKVLGRVKGKSEGGSLGTTAAFQKAMKDTGGKPGLFAYMNVPAQMALFEELAGDALGRGFMEMVQTAVNPKAFQSLTAHLGLEKGTLTFRAALAIDARERSPIVELLPKGPVSPTLLAYVPADAAAFAAISNEEGGKRLQQLLELADALHKASGGGGGAPSEGIKSLKEAVGIDVVDIAGKIRGIAGFLPPMDRFLEGIDRGPTFGVVIEASDEAAAKSLADDTLPQLAKIVARGKGEREDLKTEGYDTYRLDLGRVSLTVGRDGKTLVFSNDTGEVERAFTQARKKAFASSDLGKRIGALKAPAAVAAIRPVSMGALWFLAAHPPGGKLEAKGPKEFFETLKLEQPLLASAAHGKESFTLEASYPLREFAPRLINMAFELMMIFEAHAPAPPPVTKEEAFPKAPKD